MNHAKLVNGDWWPDRDKTCHRVAYNFKGCEAAIGRCKKLDLVIQAGGNVGAWPKYLKKIFKEVYTFEPSAENFMLLMKNIEGLGIIAAYAALGKESGKCEIKKNPWNCGDDQTLPSIQGVEVVSIDSLNMNPDLIYLDIQGDEQEALVGGRETIERCSPVIAVEVDRKMLKARDKADPVEWLVALGYVQTGKHGQDFIFERD